MVVVCFVTVVVWTLQSDIDTSPNAETTRRFRRGTADMKRLFDQKIKYEKKKTLCWRDLGDNIKSVLSYTDR